jgi:hypothetical protein
MVDYDVDSQPEGVIWSGRATGVRKDQFSMHSQSTLAGTCPPCYAREQICPSHFITFAISYGEGQQRDRMCHLLVLFSLRIQVIFTLID